jgi:hypothetical protein
MSKSFDSYPIAEIVQFHSALIADVSEYLQGVDRDNEDINVAGEFEKYRNSLVVYLKLMNTPNRVELTMNFRLNPITLIYPNTSVRCRLVFFPKSQLLARLFLYDKQGTINTVPTIVPMNPNLTSVFGQYLQRYGISKGEFIFPAKSTGQTIWKDASANLKSFMSDILNEEQKEEPNEEPTEESDDKVTFNVHKLRSIFLVYLMVKKNFAADYLRLAAYLERHDVVQSETTYMKWMRLGSFSVSQPVTQIQLTTIALPHETNEFLTTLFHPNVPDMSRHLRDRPLLPPFGNKVAEIDSEVTALKEGPFHGMYIGIDTSPKCTAVCIYYKNLSNGTNDYRVFVFNRDKKNNPNPASSAEHISIYAKEKDLLTAIETEISHQLDASDSKNDDRSTVSIAVESRLPMAYRVSAAQGRHTDRIKQEIIQMITGINLFRGPRIKYEELTVQNIIRTMERDAKAVITRDAGYSLYPRKKKNMVCMYFLERQFMSSLKGYFEEPPVLPKWEQHPLSDIVDSLAITYWLKRLDTFSVRVV